MALLNDKSFPFIRSSTEIEYRPSSFYWTLREWGTYDYWYCEIFFSDWFVDNDIEDITTPEVFEKIKTDNSTFLVICNSHEAFHKIVEPIYLGLVIKKEIPPHKIILMSESATIFKEVNRVAEKYRQRPIQVEWTLVFEKCIKIDLENQITSPLLLDSNKLYQKKFINLNRRWRLHRPAFVALLYAYNLLEYGYVSLGKSDDGRNWENIYPWLLSVHMEDPETYNLLLEKKTEIQSLPDLYLDTTDLVTNRATLNEPLEEFYQNSYFSIVSETNFYTGTNNEPGIFLSEKTFKPIAYYHPFIIVSVPGALKKIREIGYKTFHPYIDESYDSEVNDFERYKKILKEVKRLSTMTPTEVSEFIKNTSQITKHNFFLLKNKERHIHKIL